MIERDGKTFFTLDEVAEILNVDKSTVSRRLSKENLDVIREGKRFLIPYETVIRLGASKEQVDKFIEQEKQSARVNSKKSDNESDDEVDKLLQEVFGDININEFNNVETTKSQSSKSKPEVVDLPTPKKSKSESKSTSTKEPKAGKDAIKPVEQLLGKSYAEILKPTLESLEWWNTAKEHISWHAIMIALQVAKVDPAEIIHKAEEFQDPVKFANYIRDLLSAMVEAIEDAQAIQQYREELEDAYTRLKAYKFTIELQNSKIIELQQEVQTLMALLKQANEDMFLGYVMAKGIVSQMGGVEVGGSPTGSGEEIS